MTTWTIANLERNSTDNGVVVAHWRCTAEDGEYSAGVYGTVGFEPDPTSEGFVPFDKLTEADVIEWVKGSLDVEAIETQLAAQIEQQKEPPIVTGMPWTTKS